MITREGFGQKANYTVERVEQQEVDKSIFSIRGNSVEELEGEQWKTLFFDANYEVSNLGRLRNKITKIIHKGTIQKNGYVVVSVNNQNYRLHRLVLQTWCPNEDYEELTVDHINGNRSDNRLENLRWATREENTVYMMTHRCELNKEITRLLSKYSYEQVL